MLLEHVHRVYGVHTHHTWSIPTLLSFQLLVSLPHFHRCHPILFLFIILSVTVSVRLEHHLLFWLQLRVTIECGGSSSVLLSHAQLAIETGITRWIVLVGKVLLSLLDDWVQALCSLTFNCLINAFLKEGGGVASRCHSQLLLYLLFYKVDVCER